MSLNVEFTDRYDGQLPSWLRLCRHCEGMGAYPVKVLNGDWRGGFHREELTSYQSNAVHRWIETHGAEADDWYFIRCEMCHGTRHISWGVTLTRIPRWIWRGGVFMWDMRPSRAVHPPEWSWGRKVWTVFKCAFLCDLGVRP